MILVTTSRIFIPPLFKSFFCNTHNGHCRARAHQPHPLTKKKMVPTSPTFIILTENNAKNYYKDDHDTYDCSETSLIFFNLLS